MLPFLSGMQACLDDFGIPLKLSHTVVDIKGKERVEGITLAEVDETDARFPVQRNFLNAIRFFFLLV